MQGASLTMSDIQMLDRQVSQLMECKPLSETDVKQLCDKVHAH